MGQCVSVIQNAVTTLSSVAAAGVPTDAPEPPSSQGAPAPSSGGKPIPQYPQIIKHAYVSKMPDGDTLTCSYKHPDGTTATVRVRVAAIDCPELAQNYGPEARNIGQALLLHKTVTLRTTDVDRYGRLVADVITHTGINFGEYMLKKGCAHHYKDYDKRPELAQLQVDAQKNKVGLWSYPRPQPPWEYRKRKRNRIAANKKNKEENN